MALAQSQKVGGVVLPVQKTLTDEIDEKMGGNGEISIQSRLLTPDLVIAPNARRIWLRKIGEELEE